MTHPHMMVKNENMQYSVRK